MMASFDLSRNQSRSTLSQTSDDSRQISDDETGLRYKVEKKLMKRLFLGYYQERHCVELLQMYRDIVVLHGSEKELKDDLDNVQSKLRSFYGSDKWLGITNPDTIGAPAAGHCLWTRLQNVAFGLYWFQIRQICYEDREIFVRLKVIRSVHEDALTPSTSPKEASVLSIKSLQNQIQGIQAKLFTPTHKEDSPISGGNKNQDTKAELNSTPSKDGNSQNSTSDDNAKRVSTQTIELKDLVTLFQVSLLYSSKTLLFLYSACVVIFNGAAHSIEFAGKFVLDFMQMINLLLSTISPIILAVIELVGKVVGGFYLLISMFIKQINAPVPPVRQNVPPGLDRMPVRAIQYRPYPQNIRKY